MVSLNDLADRPPLAIGDEALDLGGKRMRFLPTPHVPHNWESGLWFEERTRTLLAGDLFTAVGKGPALTSSDLVAAANAGEDAFHSTSMGPDLVPTIHRLADLEPTTLAVMHGSSYTGDGAAQLRSLADSYDERLALIPA
jgi:flavorubredoxin